MFKGDLEGGLDVDLEGDSKGDFRGTGHGKGLAVKPRSGLVQFTAQIKFFGA